MNFYDVMKNHAKYIDDGMKTLNDWARTANYQSISTNEDDKLINDINVSINTLKNEIDNIYSQVNIFNGLNDLMLNASSRIQEIKLMGASMGMQFRSFPQSDYPIQSGIEYNAPSTFQSQTEIQKDPNKNYLPNSNPQLFEYSAKPTFREITNEEYQTLPPIIPLLIKIDDMNKHYQNLINNMNADTFIISGDDFSEIIQLSSSRINAFIRSLISLKRMDIIEGSDGTSYKML